jgi:hypothetical protein
MPVPTALRLPLAAVFFALPGAALAQVGPGRYGQGEGKDVRRQQSPQSFALEVKLSPYLPPLDANDASLGGATPFTDIFGTKNALMARFELDYQFLRLGRFASLAAGAGVGVYQKTGFGLDENGDPTEDENLFRVVPLSASAVLRGDYLLQAFQVPLVPFAKVGLDYYYWSNKKNGEFTKFPNGNDVRGGTAGVHANLGLAFDLNALDPKGGVGMDHSFGINHSYLFAEAELAQVNDFNSGESFDFSTTLINIGLAFEF